MKKVTLFFSAIACVLGSHSQNKVTIHAHIAGLPAGTWVYCYPYIDDVLKDSVQSKAGGFTLTVTVPEGQGDQYILLLGKKWSSETLKLLYLDKGNVSLSGPGPQFAKVVTTGGQAITDYNAYHSFIEGSPALAGSEDLYKKANDLSAKKDSAGLAALGPELQRMDSVEKALTTQWILQHTGSPVSALLITFNLGREPLSKQEALLNQLTPEARNNAPAKRLANSIRVNNLTGIGKTALDFTQNDTAGIPVSLQAFRGRYVLLDFWASWCVPCRTENPNVVAAFHKYKDKPFTILSISLDRPGDKEAWINAIHMDSLYWTNVSDLQFWNNAVAKLYDIQEIPTNLLLDPNGVIVAKNLLGEALDQKLHELLQ